MHLERGRSTACCLVGCFLARTHRLGSGLCCALFALEAKRDRLQVVMAQKAGAKVSSVLATLGACQKTVERFCENSPFYERYEARELCANALCDAPHERDVRTQKRFQTAPSMGRSVLRILCAHTIGSAGGLCGGQRTQQLSGAARWPRSCAPCTAGRARALCAPLETRWVTHKLALSQVTKNRRSRLISRASQPALGHSTRLPLGRRPSFGSH